MAKSKKHIVGKSLVKKRIYVLHGIPIELANQYKSQGYEVVSIEPFYFYQMQTQRGLCSPPFNGYSAHHCFAPMDQSALGKSYTAEYNGQQITGQVVKDYTKKVPGLLCTILSFFHINYEGCTVKDVVQLSNTFKAEGEIKGVLSAGTPSGQYALFSWHELDESLVGKTFNSISYDVDLNQIVNWQGQIIDIVTLSVFDEEDIIEVQGYLTQNGVKVKPGYSGSPMIINLNTQQSQ